ncbi:MAG: cytochrome c oxidase accessory protein CcoG [Opitutaceae bacterium]|nr:cytochrome c oxidase accessory protein CcoG [Opitutaceae bacterium]
MAASRPNLDSVTTINRDGSRPFIYPADVAGRFNVARKVSAFLLILFYLALPWIPIGGYPAVFLDVASRRFHLFGWTLATQDLWLTFFLISGLGFGLFYITSLLGRIWCGWACPQTVFLDHVYRPIERWIDGNALQRRQLAAAPWSAGKILRRVLKHTLYIIISLAITHLFLAYFVSIPELWHMMHEQPGAHWGAFGFVFITAGFLYFNFAWFREQLCIVICPYGRLQSAMIDDHSMIVGYDTRRGEPRGKLGSEGAGDCVDCNRCVHVCPTGIDIRQGLQMECIGCTACIDACDEVMRRIDKPVGLIRYDSQTALAGGKTRWLRPRTLLYSILLIIGLGVGLWAVSTIKPATVSITRITGAPYIVTDDSVRNQFLVRLLNKRADPVDFILRIESSVTFHQTGFETAVTVAPLAEDVRPLVLVVPRADYTGPFKFTVTIRDQPDRFEIAREVEFLGPDARLLKEDAP